MVKDADVAAAVEAVVADVVEKEKARTKEKEKGKASTKAGTEMHRVRTAGRVKEKEKRMPEERMEISSASSFRSVVTVDVGTMPRRIAFGAPTRETVMETVTVMETRRTGITETRRAEALAMECRL